MIGETQQAGIGKVGPSLGRPPLKIFEEAPTAVAEKSNLQPKEQPMKIYNLLQDLNRDFRLSPLDPPFGVKHRERKERAPV